jgi:hypothetical protein
MCARDTSCFTLADEDFAQKEDAGGTADELSTEAEQVLAAVIILERDNVHLERPHIRKELVELIKNHVR